MISQIHDPSNDDLKALAASQQHAQLTQWHNYNVVTKIKARSPQSTFILRSNLESWIPSVASDLVARVSQLQDQYLSKVGCFSISGSIGSTLEAAANVEFIIESHFPNIAAMQRQLLFPYKAENRAGFQVIYTPTLTIPDFDYGRGIIVDLDRFVTRIFGTDYFGESKKAGLRMWNKLIYDRGGLALHAGCKTYRNTDGLLRSMLIIGLSGTGKTTTTFTPHAHSQPLQDDFCALFPGGRIHASENGCFAKTYGLSADDEPVIHKGLTSPQAWLENVFVDADGRVDFFNDSYTTNGRGTFPLDLIPHGDLKKIPPVDRILILNKDFNIIPAIARLNRMQAAAYFMLGETMGTSAGGSAEAGKALRVPGTNPFFPLNHALQGNRFKQLMECSPNVEVYLLNTGHIGQNDRREGGVKITIEHSRKLIEAMLKDELQWKLDPDFGYQIVNAEASPVESILTNPRSYYTQHNKMDEYTQILKRVRKDRVDFFALFSKLDGSIVNSL